MKKYKYWILVGIIAGILDATVSISSLKEWQPQKINDSWQLAGGGITPQRAQFIIDHPTIHNFAYFVLFFITYGIVIAFGLTILAFWGALIKESVSDRL